jgi:ActR/RegA family two-component response regulator
MNVFRSTSSGSEKDVTLLVLDPDELLLNLRAEVLRSRGYQVDTVREVGDALLKLNGEHYAAVLVSGMSDKEVAESCERMRISRPEQLVIVVATPVSYFPPGSCPDHVIEGGPYALLEGINAALRPQ